MTRPAPSTPKATAKSPDTDVRGPGASVVDARPGGTRPLFGHPCTVIEVIVQVVVTEIREDLLLYYAFSTVTYQCSGTASIPLALESTQLLWRVRCHRTGRHGRLYAKISHAASIALPATAQVMAARHPTSRLSPSAPRSSFDFPVLMPPDLLWRLRDVAGISWGTALDDTVPETLGVN